MTKKVVVADSGPLIALAIVDCLPLLSGYPQQGLFDEVHIPNTVLDECTRDLSLPGGKAIFQCAKAGFFSLRQVEKNPTLDILSGVLDPGEAEAIALAKQLDAVLLIDERKGRTVASRHGVTITGSAAVLLKAKSAGWVPAVRPLLERLKSHGYRFSDTLIGELLARAGEGNDR